MDKEKGTMIFSYIFITILFIISIYYLYYDNYMYDYMNYGYDLLE